MGLGTLLEVARKKDPGEKDRARMQVFLNKENTHETYIESFQKRMSWAHSESKKVRSKSPVLAYKRKEPPAILF